MNLLKIVNGRVMTPGGVIRGGTVVVGEGKILEAAEGDVEVAGATTIDAQGMYVAPGFIDIHVHGGGGHDFMDATVEAFLRIAETHARFGTTSMLPTTLTASREALLKICEIYMEARLRNVTGAQFLGLHLEGPYLAMNQRGAQDARYIRDPDPGEYLEILARCPDIRRWSAAPELEGALEFGRLVSRRGILVALAHTDALYEEALLGFEHGYSLATHFYSCMNSVTRRDGFRYAGVIEFAYLHEGMDVEVIADGVHLPGEVLRLVHKIKGADRVALITDAIRAAGMPDGETILGSLQDGQRVIVEDGVAKLPDRSSFAGSVATADRLVRTMVRDAGVRLEEAVQMMTSTPARIIGFAGSKGSLASGMDADIVIFDEDVRVSMTMVGGRVVYQKEDL
jgi:N-acetylglucosamine-6-phosphate deacetylase